MLKNKVPWKITGPKKDAGSYLKYIVKNFLIIEVS
jgi:hypothetical protein